MGLRKTGVDWAHYGWNPLIGCSRQSAGCRNCYAETMAARVANAGQAKLRRGGVLTATEAAYRDVVRWERGGMLPGGNADKALPRWSGIVRLLPDRLGDPVETRAGGRVFADGLSDLFHPSVPYEAIAVIFGAMLAAPHHRFLVLTKHPDRAADWFSWIESQPLGPVTECSWAALSAERDRIGDGGPIHTRGAAVQSWPPSHVWLGTSVEDQPTTARRVSHLLRCPLPVLWISAEPLLGPVNLTHLDVDGYDGAGGMYQVNALTGRNTDMGRPCESTRRLSWVVAGGESGHGARPMHPDWPRSLRDQCAAARVPFFFKQWGEWAPAKPSDPDLPSRAGYVGPDGGSRLPPGDGSYSSPRRLEELGCAFMARFGKSAAGRLLDSVLHDEYPEAP